MNEEISKEKIDEINNELLNRRHANEARMKEITGSTNEMKKAIYFIGFSLFVITAVCIYLLVVVLM
jgi:hypothetical protein